MNQSLVSRLLPALSVLVVALVAGLFISDNRVWLDTMVYAGIYAMIALSIGIAYGQGGMLSIAQAAFATVGAYATAVVTLRFGVSPWIGLVAAVLVPAALGYIMARVLVRLSHLALAIATLVVGEIVLVLIRQGGSVTGGFIGLSGIPGLDRIDGAWRYYLLVWGALGLVLVLYANLRASAFGRALTTAKHDTLRARADGIRVESVLARTFALSAGVAGLGGWLYAHYVSYVAPESLPPLLSISVILMAVVGGVVFIAGPVVGAVGLTILQTFLPSDEIQGLLYGGTLIIVLIGAPSGVLGLAQRLARMLGRRRDGKPLPHDADKQPGEVPARAEVVGS